MNGSITVNGVNVPIRNYIVDGNISDGCTAWGVHNGTYTVPAGQYVSRFFFVAVASASGDSEEGLKRGNLIDRVWFSTDPVPPGCGQRHPARYQNAAENRRYRPDRCRADAG